VVRGRRSRTRACSTTSRSLAMDTARTIGPHAAAMSAFCTSVGHDYYLEFALLGIFGYPSEQALDDPGLVVSRNDYSRHSKQVLTVMASSVSRW
jgi:hypothetical protein